MPLNVELTRTWIVELRSGKWKQGRHALRDTDDHYCCLGVLCELWKKPWLGACTSVGKGVYIHSVEELTGNLTNSEKIEIGLSENRYFNLIGMNDTGKSFNDIADKLEQWLKEDADAQHLAA